jgi:hypothetical protein
MPFKSKAQQGFMFSKHPKIANKWADKYGVSKNLPAKLGKKKMSVNERIKNARSK